MTNVPLLVQPVDVVFPPHPLAWAELSTSYMIVTAPLIVQKSPSVLGATPPIHDVPAENRPYDVDPGNPPAFVETNMAASASRDNPNSANKAKCFIVITPYHLTIHCDPSRLASTHIPSPEIILVVIPKATLRSYAALVL